MIRSTAYGLAVSLVVALGAVTLAAAQTPDEQALCQDDAFRVCSQTIPDRERTFQCMVANRELLSPGCRVVMARLLPPEPTPQKASAPRARKGQGPLNLSPAATR